MSLITCGSIHEGHEWFSDDSRARQEIFMCLAALLCEQFCRFANGSAKISIKSHFIRYIFFSVYWAAVKCWAKLLPFGVNCRLQLAGLGKIREETVKPTCFMSKATSVPHTPQAAQALFVIYIRDSIALRLNHLRECMKMVRKSL